MIYTVTFNPSLDYTIHVENFELGNSKPDNGAEKIFMPEEKELMYLWCSKTWDMKRRHLVSFPDLPAQEIERLLKEKGISTEFIHIENGTSRINLKIRSDVESEINGMGPVIRKEDLRICCMSSWIH